MSRSLQNAPQLREFTGRMVEGISLGTAWGGLAGAIIGTGISLAIGLFYSSATGLILGVVLGSSLLGALLGHVMGGLFVDEIVFAGPLSLSPYAPRTEVDAAELCAHKSLKVIKEEKMIKNQNVVMEIRDFSTMHDKDGSAISRRSDARIFELIVANSHKADSTEQWPGL
jgi:hypothetical protein